MELMVLPHNKNLYELKGLLIKGDSMQECLQKLNSICGVININEENLYAIPNLDNDGLYGFFIPNISFNQNESHLDLIAFQKVYGNFYIPMYSTLYPSITDKDFRALFDGSLCVFIQELGLVQLQHSIHLASLIDIDINIKSKKPAAGCNVFYDIISYHVLAKDPEEALQDLEQNNFPQYEERKNDKLNIIEKARLGIYKSIDAVGKKLNLQNLANKIDFKGLLKEGNSKNWNRVKNYVTKSAKKLDLDYQELERRNQKEVEKLINMLSNDPEKMLKHALPLEDNMSRSSDISGSIFGSLGSLLGNFLQSDGSGPSVLLNYNDYNKLRQHYEAMAKEFILKNDYKNAAYVYLKLLKNYKNAAEVLKNGKMYIEAASIYLKYFSDKYSAAECYELAKMYKEAIAIYLELNKIEKVADLYALLNQKEKAIMYYKKLAEDYIKNSKYIDASKIYKEKMNDMTLCQNTLLLGFINNKETFNCLHSYFNNLNDETLVFEEIKKINSNFVSSNNVETFLKALKFEYKKYNNLKPFIRSVANEAISIYAKKNNKLLDNLVSFRNINSQVTKDILLYKDKVN